MNAFDREIDRILRRIAEGGMAILTTSAPDFATGHLAMSAHHVTAEAVNFMAKHGKGLISLALTAADVDRLHLQPITRRGRQDLRQNPLVSIEAEAGVSTGISAADRAHTIRTAIDSRMKHGAIVSPGHVFPLRLHPDGTLARTAPAEAAADLCAMAGLPKAAMLCGILAADGEVANGSYLAELAREHDLVMISIDALAAHLSARPSAAFRAVCAEEHVAA